MAHPEFAKTGSMARPAGVAGLMAGKASNMGMEELYGMMAARPMTLKKHALQMASPYAEVAPIGWQPREPGTKPTWNTHGAGKVSAGCIDNTYLVKPLQNAWGKARELAQNEKRVLPHKQASDLLAVSKGAQMPPVPQQMWELDSVRDRYSQCIPFYHFPDPMRIDTGFIRGPNTIPGVAAPPETPAYKVQHEFAETWREQKLRYEQNDRSNATVPVLKVVTTASEHKAPNKNAPIFLRKPAGLPGGLSLIKND